MADPDAILHLRRALYNREAYRIADQDGGLVIEVTPADVWGRGVMRLDTPSGRIYAESAIVLHMGEGAWQAVGHRDGKPSGYLNFAYPEAVA